MSGEDPNLGLAKQLAISIAAPILGGIILTTLLFGIFFMQLYTYWRYKFKDPLLVRCAVLLVASVSTLELATGVYLAFHYTVLIFGDLDALQAVVTPTAILPICVVLTGTSMQSYFAWRIRKLTGSWLIPGIVWTLALGEIAVMLWSVIGVTRAQSWQGLASVRTPILTWSILSPIADIVVSVTLIIYLRRRLTGPFARTDDVISKINRLAIQTGLLTVVWTILCLLLYVVSSQGALELYVLYPLCLVYSICFMSSQHSESSRSYPSAPKGVNVYKTSTVTHDFELSAVGHRQNHPPIQEQGDIEDQRDDKFLAVSRGNLSPLEPKSSKVVVLDPPGSRYQRSDASELDD